VVHFPGSTRPARLGGMTRVLIEQAFPHSLFGRQI
jgi:hypothetical protein